MPGVRVRGFAPATGKGHPDMDLAAYLTRIGYGGEVAPTHACLTSVHRAHAFSIPYENLDVQLGRRVDFDLARIHAKIVTQPRGGWCYETHVLLEWALREIGFDVMTVAAGIHREERGDAALGDHTALLVRMERTWLVDLGLGDGIREPIPLDAGEHRQGALSFRLERLDDGHWRFRNHALAFPTNFDFREAPADRALLERWNIRQQTDPDSVLKANLVCQIMRPESVVALTGRVLREKTLAGTTKTLVAENGFVDVLWREFGIRDPDAGRLWPLIAARHTAVFGDRSAEEIDIDGF